jgi:hypothetical protein
VDDVLRLLLAGGRLAAEPGVQVQELDRVVARLVARDPGVDSAGQAQEVLRSLLPLLWGRAGGNRRTSATSSAGG